MQRFNAMTSDSGDTKTEKQTTENLVGRSTTKVSIVPRYCNDKTRTAVSSARLSNQKRPSEDKVRTKEGEETIYDNQAVKKYRTGDAQQNMGVSELDSKKKNSDGNTHNKGIATVKQENRMKQNLNTKRSSTLNTDQS